MTVRIYNELHAEQNRNTALKRQLKALRNREGLLLRSMEELKSANTALLTALTLSRGEKNGGRYRLVLPPVNMKSLSEGYTSRLILRDGERVFEVTER